MKKHKANHVSLLCSAAFCCLLHYEGSGEVALPKHDLIGTRFETIGNVLHIPSEATLPQSITLELDAGKLSGIVCDYSEADASYSSVKTQLEKALGQPPRMDGPITTVWRLEEKKCAVMLTWDKEAKIIQVIIRPVGKAILPSKSSKPNKP